MEARVRLGEVEKALSQCEALGRLREASKTNIRKALKLLQASLVEIWGKR